MATRADWLALAARAEAAKGADRALDAAVACALEGIAFRKMLHDGTAFRTSAGDRGLWGVAFYSRSLDVALAVVPEGWTGMVHLDGKAGLYRDDRQPTIDGSALTPALALLAAACRARAEEAGDA